MRNKKDLETLKSLIEKGEKLLKKCESVRGGNFHNPRRYERLGSAWYIESINFLSVLFGPNSIQTKKFAKYFGTYTSTNLMGMYGGQTHFVKEDVQKAIGHLEGIHDSLSKGYLKKINYVFRAFYKFWIEFKEFLGFISNINSRKK